MNFQEIIQSDKPVLIDFFATWCGPCKMMPSILTELKQKMGHRASIIKIDVDKNKKVAQQYQIQSVPTLMLFKNGKLIWRKSGVIPARELEKMILPHV